MAETTRQIISIRGLTAAGAEIARQVLTSLPGLYEVTSDLTRQRLEVEYDPVRYGILTATLMLRAAGLPAVIGEHG